MFKKYSEDIKNCIHELGNKKTFYKQIPNLLTSVRAIGVIPVNILFFTGNVIPAVIIMLCMLITDMFDGKLARKYNVVSEFGADLDAFCDKVMAIGLSIPIIAINSLFLINILFECGIGFVNIMNKVKGGSPKTNYAGKVKTCFLSLTMGLGYLASLVSVSLNLFNTLIYSTTLIQVIALYNYLIACNIKDNKQNDINVTFDNNMKTDIIIENKKSIKEELIREKEFYLGMKEPIENIQNRRVKEK